MNIDNLKRILRSLENHGVPTKLADICILSEGNNHIADEQILILVNQLYIEMHRERVMGVTVFYMDPADANAIKSSRNKPCSDDTPYRWSDPSVSMNSSQRSKKDKEAAIDRARRAEDDFVSELKLMISLACELVAPLKQ